MGVKWSEYEINILNDNYEMGAEYITSILDRSRVSIQHKLSRMSLFVSSETKSKISKENGLKRKLKDSYSVVDITTDIDQYSAYILGLLWTDGFISNKRKTIGITMIKEDMLDISWIFNRFGNWYINDRRRENRRETRTLSTYNPKLLNSLILCDFDKKSYFSPERLFSIVPNDYIKYLVRGIIDGDGCFYINQKQYTYQLTIASTYEQDWIFYIDFFSKLGFDFTIQKRINQRSKSSIIRLCKRNMISDFSRWLYDGYDSDRIGLSRKYYKSLLFLK